MVNSDSQRPSYFYGLDYLRAFFAIAVVAWHTKVFGITELFDITKINKFHVSAVDIAYFNVLLIAVPLFFQISLFLYINKREKQSNYFLKRIRVLISLLVFWVVMYMLLTTGLIVIPFSQWPWFFISGGNSIFYFFSNLILLTIIAEVFIGIKAKISIQKFLVLQLSLLSITFAIFIFKTNIAKVIPEWFKIFFIPFWSPTNFFPYVFSAFIIYYIYQQKVRIKPVLFVCLFLAYLFICILEWLFLQSEIFFPYDGYFFPPYERVSLILGSSVILVFALNKNIKTTPPIIKQLSEMSLGIYCVHIFFSIYITKICPPLNAIIFSSQAYVFLFVFIMASIITYFIKYKRII